MSDHTASHAELMDATYRYQRFIYDLTRRYFLLGRDHLLESLNPPVRGRVLEVACGTGRNLAVIARRRPDCQLFGIDISDEMLRTARARLPGGVRLAHGDACSFAGSERFGAADFDRVILSYSVSMIPDWRAAIENALRHLAPCGQLHLVDFGENPRLPGWLRAGLHGFLARHHVTPRAGLGPTVTALAARADCTARSRPIFLGYAEYAVVTRSRGETAPEPIPAQP